jgi:uncharacterized protein YqeY
VSRQKVRFKILVLPVQYRSAALTLFPASPRRGRSAQESEEIEFIQHYLELADTVLKRKPPAARQQKTN